MTQGTTATWRIADDVVWEVGLDGRHVHALLAPDGEVMVFSDTAATIWQAVADGIDPVRSIEFDGSADRAAITAGTLEFLDDLAHAGMVAKVESAHAASEEEVGA